MAAVRSDHEVLGNEALAERRKSGPGLWSSNSEDHYVKEGSGMSCVAFRTEP
jgi:hypothetical protein